jgi:hypothetical protein
MWTDEQQSEKEGFLDNLEHACFMPPSPQLDPHFLFEEQNQEDPFNFKAQGAFGCYDPFLRLATETTGGWNSPFDCSLENLGDTQHPVEQEVSSTKSEVGSLKNLEKAISYESLVSSICESTHLSLLPKKGSYLC